MRAKIMGTPERPRLSVFRSNRYTYVQLIDDIAHQTLASASTRGKSEAKKDKNSKVREAYVLGKMIAEEVKKIAVKSVIFDRGRYAYHGRVKAIAEVLRKEGVKI